MNTGKLVRMNRHFFPRLGAVVLRGGGSPLWDTGRGCRPACGTSSTTLAAVVAAQPDAVTMHKGIAASAWQPYAGRVPLIIQSTGARPDDSAREQFADPLDAVRLGADAFRGGGFYPRRDRGPRFANRGRLRSRGRRV